MRFFKNVNFHVIALLTVLLSILFTYWNLPNSFFQQDEWQTFASDIYFRYSGITGVIESFLPSDPLSHFNPLSRVFAWFEYIFYYIDFRLYAWQSITLHILNTFLLYYFVLSWLKNRKIAIFSSIFFGINSIPHQAVTWVAAANSFEIPTTCILLSLIFFHRFLEHTKHRKINLSLTLLMLFVSLLFHEIGMFLFLFYPIIFLLHVKPGRKKLLKMFSTGIVFTLVIFIIMRIPLFFGPSSTLPEATDISRPPITIYSYRLISLGMKSFAGSLFPEKTLIAISDGLVRLVYPQFLTSDGIPNPFITQSIVFDMVSYALSVVIISVVVLGLLFIRDKKTNEAVYWSLVFVPLSVLPYALVLGKAGYASIFEPKFLYTTSIGTSVLLANIFHWVIYRFSKSRVLTSFVLFCLVFYVLFHMFQITSNVKALEKIGMQRKAFLTSINSSYPHLPKEIIFFTQSNIAYYGMPDNEKILPVQIGFGKMLMIWYQRDEEFPGCLYEQNFLLDLLEEGYRYCENRGFGYFRHYDKLVDVVKEHSVPIENVIAYTWDGETLEFTDQTNVVRKKLAQDLQSNETKQ